MVVNHPRGINPGLTAINNFLQLDDHTATSGQPTIEQFSAIKDADYRVLINLAHPDSRGYLPEEGIVVRGYGLVYIHIPVPWKAPDRSDFEQFHRELTGLHETKCFIHCIANKRVSVFMALYRITQLGWDIVTALKAVEAVWHPNETWTHFIKKSLEGVD